MYCMLQFFYANKLCCYAEMELLAKPIAIPLSRNDCDVKWFKSSSPALAPITHAGTMNTRARCVMYRRALVSSSLFTNIALDATTAASSAVWSRSCTVGMRARIAAKASTRTPPPESALRLATRWLQRRGMVSVSAQYLAAPFQ